jgi:hypothetical protein
LLEGDWKQPPVLSLSQTVEGRRAVMKPIWSTLWGVLFSVWLGVSGVAAQDPLETLEQDLELPPPPAAAEAQPGYLGLTVDLMRADAKSVFIESVVEGGPAARGGLKADDVILEVDGQKISGLEDLGRMVGRPPGTVLTFKVRRNNVPQRFQVTVGARPSADQPADEAPANELPAPATPAAPQPEAATPVPGTEGGPTIVQGSRPQLGISVADAEQLTDADKRRFGVVVDSGAVISRIIEGAPAARAGLPLGGVVVSINGQRISSAQDIVDLVQTFRPGQMIEVTYWEGDRVGRKRVRVGSAAAAVAPAEDGAAQGTTRRPRRLGANRPLLNAIEQLLDDVLPPPPGRRRAGVDPPTPPVDIEVPAESAEPREPPPPPGEITPELPDVDVEPPVTGPGDRPTPSIELPAPSAEVPGSTGSAEELEQLRKQAAEVQKQLESLLKRIEELEKKKQAG